MMPMASGDTELGHLGHWNRMQAYSQPIFTVT